MFSHMEGDVFVRPPITVASIAGRSLLYAFQALLYCAQPNMFHCFCNSLNCTQILLGINGVIEFNLQCSVLSDLEVNVVDLC